MFRYGINHARHCPRNYPEYCNCSVIISKSLHLEAFKAQSVIILGLHLSTVEFRRPQHWATKLCTTEVKDQLCRHSNCSPVNEWLDVSSKPSVVPRAQIWWQKFLCGMSFRRDWICHFQHFASTSRLLCWIEAQTDLVTVVCCAV